MTINILELLRIELFICLIVLVIVFIVVGIKLIKTLSRIDKTLDDVNSKMNRIDKAFDVMGKHANFVDSISDKIISAITMLLKKIIDKRKGNDSDE